MKLGSIGKERGEQSLGNLFEIEFNKVIENIMDARTYPIDKRKIQINIAFVPGVDRERVRIAYDIKTTLAPIMGGNTEFDIFDDGEGIIIRPTVSSSKLKGQVDYRDVLPDDDGVYPEDEA
ncbi:MAG: hypothetical protein AB7D35_11275 [Bacteroidales bacterium]